MFYGKLSDCHSSVLCVCRTITAVSKNPSHSHDPYTNNRSLKSEIWNEMLIQKNKQWCSKTNSNRPCMIQPRHITTILWKNSHLKDGVAKHQQSYLSFSLRIWFSNIQILLGKECWNYLMIGHKRIQWCNKTQKKDGSSQHSKTLAPGNNCLAWWFRV